MLVFITILLCVPELEARKVAVCSVALLPLLVKFNDPPSKVKFASPTRFVPLPPVMIRLSALLDIVADPVAP